MDLPPAEYTVSPRAEYTRPPADYTRIVLAPHAVALRGGVFAFHRAVVGGICAEDRRLCLGLAYVPLGKRPRRHPPTAAAPALLSSHLLLTRPSDSDDSVAGCPSSV